MDYYLGLNDVYEHWLPIKNKSMHLQELVVDGDVTVKNNMVVSGDVASGGVAGENVGR